MKKIKLLDNNTINKIAAGEVVERPSSVVKELCENSIDAQASAITIEIKDGGTSLIKISDNGKGIEKEQVETAFIRHATSKIESIEDLDNVYSLGFRGEALASISAVSQVEMITKTYEEEIGYKIEISGGTIISAEDYASTTGTTILVKNIFYNVPARRKFLKKPSTESSYISDIVNRLALAHPEISIKYINNGNVMLHTSGNNDLKTAVFHVYGKDASQKMLSIPVAYEEFGFKLEGLLGKPELSRGNRNYENLFINGRFVKNEVVSQAVEDAYKTKIMGGRFPFFVLNLSLSSENVDVNVHPAKLEVRFRDEDAIYDFVYNSVIHALKSEVLIPEIKIVKSETSKEENLSINSENIPENKKFVKSEDVQQQLNSIISSSTSEENKYNKELPSIEELQQRYKSGLSSNDFSTKNSMNEEKIAYVQDVDNKKQEPQKDFSKEAIESQLKKEEIVEEPEERFFNNYNIIGQVFLTYWLIEQNSSLYLIDQHAAHERILFEDIFRKIKNEKILSQRLLQPIMLNLTELEKNVLKDNVEIIETFGFEIEYFPDDTFSIKAVPYIFQRPEGIEFFNEILDTLEKVHSNNSIYDIKLDKIATIACKAAVKGNDKLSISEAKSLIEKLLLLENPFNCPHGRPTIVEITKYEMEKMFKRIV